MSETRELTLGEKRCHISFNPSANGEIETFKRMMADAIDYLENVRKSIPSGDLQKEEAGEIHRVISIAQDDLESAQMFGVKGIAKMLK